MNFSPQALAFWMSEILVPFMILAITAFGIFMLFRSHNFRLKAGSIELSAFNKTESEIRDRLETVSKTAGPSERQFALLKEYHAQGLAQSRVSFWFSLIFASLGFLIILYSIFFYLGDSSKINSVNEIMNNNSIHKPIFALVCGTVVEAVAALFFVQSNKARQLMSEFFDKARTDRKLDESLVLSSEIKDKYVAARLKAYLAASFADSDPTESVVAMILGSSIADKNIGGVKEETQKSKE